MNTPNLQRQIDAQIETDIDFWVELKHADDAEQLELLEEAE